MNTVKAVCKLISRGWRKGTVSRQRWQVQMLGRQHKVHALWKHGIWEAVTWSWLPPQTRWVWVAGRGDLRLTPPPRWGGPRGVFITYLWGTCKEFAIWIPGGKVLILPFLREPGWVSATGPELGRAKEMRFILPLTSMLLLLATSAAEIFTNLRRTSFLEFL